MSRSRAQQETSKDCKLRAGRKASHAIIELSISNFVRTNCTFGTQACTSCNKISIAGHRALNCYALRPGTGDAQ